MKKQSKDIEGRTIKEIIDQIKASAVEELEIEGKSLEEIQNEAETKAVNYVIKDVAGLLGDSFDFCESVENIVDTFNTKIQKALDAKKKAEDAKKEAESHKEADEIKITNLKKDKEKLEGKVDELNKTVNEQKGTHSAAIRKLNENHQNELETKENLHKQALSKQKSEYESKLTEKDGYHNLALKVKEEEIANKQKEIDTQKKAHETEISNIKAGHRKVLESKDKEIGEFKNAVVEYVDFITETFSAFTSEIKQLNDGMSPDIALAGKMSDKVLDNDYFGLEEFCKEIAKSINETKSKDVRNVNDALRGVFLECLKQQSWIDVMAQLYLYVQVPEIAAKLKSDGLKFDTINQTFAATKQICKMLGIELFYPQLFVDKYNPDCYELKNVCDLQQLFKNIPDVAKGQNDVIIDILRVGYTYNGETRKPVVVKFM